MTQRIGIMESRSHGISFTWIMWYVNEAELFLILVDFFSGWSKVIHVPNRIATVTQILRVIFPRNYGPKTKASKCCDEELHSCLRKTRCTPYKKPPYQP